MRRAATILAAMSLAGTVGCANMAQKRFESRWMNQPAPDFELTALGGGNVKLSEQKGRPVVLAFWACGCPPCRAEAPHLSKLSDEYKLRNLVVLGVNAWDEPKEEVSRFAKENQLKHKILLDGSGVKAQYGVESIPTVFWIDREGFIRDIELGFGGAEDLKQRTERLLK